METNLNKQDMIYIVKQKIKFANEQIFNYDIDLQMGQVEVEGSDPARYEMINIYRQNAINHLDLLNQKLAELEALPDE
jgi:hypothetical protein